MDLVPRFHDVLSGRIVLDGHDIRDLSVTSLRALMGIVTQETFLFADSIGYNIAYGRPGATQADIERAARMAQPTSSSPPCPTATRPRWASAG
jgi:ATP-binding cassette subfamily B protein